MRIDRKTMDRQLEEYRQQQIKANKNRQSLFRDYDRSTIVTNIDDPYTGVDNSDDEGGILNRIGNAWDSAKQSMSDLWNSINYDMDK